MYRIRIATSDDAAAIAHVHVESWKTAYAGLIPESVLQNMSRTDRETNWHQCLQNATKSDFVFLAEVTGNREIIGFSHGTGGEVNSGDIHNHEGEVTAIYVLEQHRGNGAGLRLMQRSIDSFLEMGLRSMNVRVLAKSSYRKFYEGLGGEATACDDAEIGGRLYETLRYRWMDLDILSDTIRRRIVDSESQ